MKEEISAGGVVFRQTPEGLQILVAQHAGHHGWVFPKGHVGDKIAHETKEQAALREVTEETGVVGKILLSISPIDYWYSWNGEKRHKTVYYFLMEYVSGDMREHDFEMEKVEWIPFEDVEKRLTYEGDKKTWNEAKVFRIRLYK